MRPQARRRQITSWPARHQGAPQDRAMSRYRKRLEADIERWIEAGLVKRENRSAMLDMAGTGGASWSATGAVAILGAALLALAAITFVAANWADMDRILRFALLAAALYASFGGAALAFARRNPAIGHALALLGAALFGASILLVAQTFNMASFRNTGVLIWAVGALVTAIAIPSRPVLILTSLLGAGYVLLESVNPYAPIVIWSYGPLWLATVAAAARLNSPVSWSLASIGLGIWLGFLVMEAGAEAGLSELERASLFTLAAGAVALIAAQARDFGLEGAGVLRNWAAVGALGAGFTLQLPFEHRAASDSVSFAETLSAGAPVFVIAGAVLAVVIIALALWRGLSSSLGRTAGLSIAVAAGLAYALPFLSEAVGPGGAFVIRLALGAVVFAVATGLVIIGGGDGRRIIGGLGVALFVAQALYIYSALFGGLLSTALFFLIGGALLLALSAIGVRLARRREAATE